MGEDLFNNFEEILTDTAEDKWDNLARDIMYDYLKTLKHPMKITPHDHSAQIKMMVHYSKKLPGLSPALNADQTKKMVFDQHPEKWQ
eukprot:251687-Ditylum_brightwellii.AAC.1